MNQQYGRIVEDQIRNVAISIGIVLLMSASALAQTVVSVEGNGVYGATSGPYTEVTNMLVRRGKEWHPPDRMIINAPQIVLIEPVTSGSRVAQLIAEASK